MKRKTKSNEKLDRPVKHEKPPIEWKIFIGEKYYRRMQPVPWINKKVKVCTITLHP